MIKGDNMIQDLMKDLLFFSTDEGAGAPATPAPVETPEATTPTEKAPESFKTYATEDDYNNAIKSERSKAKNEILQELGIGNVKEGRDNMAKASALQTQLDEIADKNSKLEENLILNKNGVKEDFAQEALILAKGQVNDEVNLETALANVLNKFPTMRNTGFKTPSAVGTEKGKGKDEGEGTVKKHITDKWAWIEL